jgi:hypothetical protein
MIFNSLDEIFAHIDGVRTSLTNKVKELGDADLNQRCQGEGWCPEELVEHLSIVERSITNVVERLLAKSEEINRPAGADGKIDPPVKFTSAVRKAGLNKVEAPERIRPQGGVPVAESLEKLEESRGYIRGLRPRMAAIDLSDAKFPHPMMGELNLYQWLVFISEHEARHLAQIENILNS